MAKGLRWGRTWTVLAVLAALTLPLCVGCSQKNTKMETSIFAMDTVMDLTFYGVDPEAALKGVQEELVAELYSLEEKLSTTKETSELYALNEQGQASLSPETAELLTQALELCELTHGALDITAYPAVRAWGFTTGSYRVPDQAELEQLAAGIDYTQLEVDEQEGTARIPQGMAVDLGAVTKGYAGDRLAQQLEQVNITSALLDLGQSTIRVVGSKPDGSPWRIAVQDPAGEGYLGVIELTDLAVGTSGGYQRFFEQDGETYWHILDPDTAAPARSGLTSVTVVGPSGLVCDGLSTALFVMGLEEGAQFWRSHPELEVELLFVTEDGTLYITPGMEEMFSLGQGYEDREVQVLQ